MKRAIFGITVALLLITGWGVTNNFDTLLHAKQNAPSNSVTIADPVGDTCVYTEPTPKPDIASVTATKVDNTVVFTIAYAGAFGWGTVWMDTDQNPATGRPLPEGQTCLVVQPIGAYQTVEPPGTIPPSGGTFLGVDYYIAFNIWEGTATLFKVEIVNGGGTLPPDTAPPEDTPIATVPYVQTATSVEITIGLGLMGNDDGSMDFIVDLNLPEADDRAPNSGHGTLTVVEDTTPPVITALWIGKMFYFLADDNIVVEFGAEDPESGIATLEANIDSVPVSSGVPIPARNIGIGLHYLRITAVNGAGMTATKEYSVNIKGTIPDIADKIALGELQGKIKNEGIAQSLYKKLENAEKALQKGNVKSALGELDALRKELIGHLKQSESGKSNPWSIDPDCAGGVLTMTNTYYNYLLKRETGYFLGTTIIFYASGGINPDSVVDSFRDTRWVTDTIQIGELTGEDKVKLPRMKVIGYPGEKALEKHVSDKKGIHFEMSGASHLKFTLGKVTTDDIPEGAQLEQEVFVNNQLIGVIDVYIPPQRLIQVIMGEAGGNIGLELKNQGERTTVRNRYGQTLSPSAIGVGWTVKNRVEVLLNRDFRPGYFATKEPSYSAVITKSQFDSIDKDPAVLSFKRETVKNHGRLEQYDIVVETAATVFGDGLMSNPLVKPRDLMVKKEDRVYWFFSPPQAGVDTIEDAMLQWRNGSAGELKSEIPAYPIDENVPAQIVIYEHIPIRLHAGVHQGFAFLRLMVDPENEKTVTIGPDIAGD